LIALLFDWRGESWMKSWRVCPEKNFLENFETFEERTERKNKGILPTHPFLPSFPPFLF